MWLDDQRAAKVTFNWLSGESAKRISEIVRKHKGKVQRLAQERGALGYCRIVATFSEHPGWATNVESLKSARAEIISEGLTNQLTL